MNIYIYLYTGDIPTCFIFHDLYVLPASLQVALLDNDCAGEGDVPTCLDRLYEDLATYCRHQKINLHMCRLTRHLLGFSKDSDFPCGMLGVITLPHTFFYFGLG